MRGMRYKLLLFDLDDTLLDFGANEAESLGALFALHGMPLTDERFRVYNAVNRQLWADYEAGEIALEQVLNTRFSETMRRLGVQADGAAWEDEYRALLGEGAQLMEGALELCQSLSASHRLFAVTNGITQTQQRRMQKSGLAEFFEAVFDSQSIGYQKPSPRFFDYVAGHIEGFHKAEALIIGDSPATDIRGGMLAGIDTCWLNTRGRECPADIRSTYTVTSLAEVYGICMG